MLDGEFPEAARGELGHEYGGTTRPESEQHRVGERVRMKQRKEHRHAVALDQLRVAGGHLRRPQRIAVGPYDTLRPRGGSRGVLDVVRPAWIRIDTRQRLLIRAKVLEGHHTARDFNCRKCTAVRCAAGDKAKALLDSEDQRKMSRLRQDNARSAMRYEVVVFLL